MTLYTKFSMSFYHVAKSSEKTHHAIERHEMLPNIVKVKRDLCLCFLQGRDISFKMCW